MSSCGLNPRRRRGWRVRGLWRAPNWGYGRAAPGQSSTNSRYRRAEPCGGACLARRMGAGGSPGKRCAGTSDEPGTTREWTNQALLNLRFELPKRPVSLAGAFLRGLKRSSKSATDDKSARRHVWPDGKPEQKYPSNKKARLAQAKRALIGAEFSAANPLEPFRTTGRD